MQTQSRENHAAAQARFASAMAAQRKHLIQIAQVARQQLGWNEEEWHTVKLAQTGEDSLTKMEAEQIEKVIQYAESQGFKRTHAKANGKRSRPLSGKEQAKKLRALWLSMAGAGLIRHADESALGSWLANSRSPNVSADPDMLDVDSLSAAIERLKQWRTRLLLAGQLECPICQKPFKPSPKQAAAFGFISCDKHRLPVPYRFVHPQQKQD